MDKNLFRSLLDAKNLTLEMLRTKAPPLADPVAAVVRQAGTRASSKRSRPCPSSCARRSRQSTLTKTTGNLVEHVRARLVELGVSDEGR